MTLDAFRLHGLADDGDAWNRPAFLAGSRAGPGCPLDT